MGINNVSCIACGSVDKVWKSSVDGNLYCNKHHRQMWGDGRIREKTIYDPNKFILHDTYCEIVMYDKKCEESGRTVIDLEDVGKCMKYKWYIRNGYPTASISPNQKIRINRFILGINDKTIRVDHKDRNTLNNRKSNLRTCTQHQNSLNRVTRECNGVVWNKSRKKWVAQMTYNYRPVYFGGWGDYEIAKMVRVVAEINVFKEFSPLWDEYNYLLIENFDIDEFKSALKRINFSCVALIK